MGKQCKSVYNEVKQDFDSICYLGTRSQSLTLASPKVSTSDEEFWELMHAETQNGRLIENPPSAWGWWLGSWMWAATSSLICPICASSLTSAPSLPVPPFLKHLSSLGLQLMTNAHSLSLYDRPAFTERKQLTPHLTPFIHPSTEQQAQRGCLECNIAEVLTHYMRPQRQTT